MVQVSQQELLETIGRLYVEIVKMQELMNQQQTAITERDKQLTELRKAYESQGEKPDS